MKRFYLFLILVSLYLHFSFGAVISETDSRKQIRILSYNVRNCLGLDNKVDYQRVADVIAGTGADIVALQELDSATSRSKGLSVIHELSKSTGMIPTYRSAINFQGGKYGIGILSREKPIHVEGMPLPGKEELRTVLVVEMKHYVLACTHLSLTQADRLKSVALIDQLVKKFTKPVFLAGDLNAVPGSEEISFLSRNWQFLNDTARWTIPADKPRSCIDYIMVRKSPRHKVKVLETVVGNEPLASDHLPVWVEVKMK